MGFSKTWGKDGLTPKRASELTKWKKKTPEKQPEKQLETRKAVGFTRNHTGGEEQ